MPRLNVTPISQSHLARPNPLRNLEKMVKLASSRHRRWRGVPSVVRLESVPLSVQFSGPSSLGVDAGMTGFSLSSPRSGSHQLLPARVGCLGGFRFAGQDRIVPGLLLHNRIAFGWLPRETKVRVVWLATRLFPVVGHRTPDDLQVPAQFQLARLLAWLVSLT